MALIIHFHIPVGFNQGSQLAAFLFEYPDFVTHAVNLLAQELDDLLQVPSEPHDVVSLVVLFVFLRVKPRISRLLTKMFLLVESRFLFSSSCLFPSFVIFVMISVFSCLSYKRCFFVAIMAFFEFSICF